MKDLIAELREQCRERLEVYGALTNKLTVGVIVDDLDDLLAAAERGLEREGDGEAISEEWLRERGFKEQPGWNGLWLGDFRYITYSNPSIPPAFTLGQAHLRSAENATRGQLLALLRALGITPQAEEPRA